MIGLSMVALLFLGVFLLPLGYMLWRFMTLGF